MNREEALVRCMEVLGSSPYNTIPSGSALLRPYYESTPEGIFNWLVDEKDWYLWKALNHMSYRARGVITKDKWCEEALDFVLSRGKADEVDASSLGVFLGEVLAHPNFPAAMTWYAHLLSLYRHLLDPRSQDLFVAYTCEVIRELNAAASLGQLERQAFWALHNVVLAHIKRGQWQIINDLDRWYESAQAQSLNAMMSVIKGALLINKKGVEVEALWAKGAAGLEARLDMLEIKANPDPEDYYFEDLIELYRRLNEPCAMERVWLKRLARLKSSVELTEQLHGPMVTSGLQSRLVGFYERLMSWDGRQNDYQTELREAAEYKRELTRRWMCNAPKIQTQVEIPTSEIEAWLDRIWEDANEPWQRLGCDRNGIVSRQQLLAVGANKSYQPSASRLFGSSIVDEHGRPLRHYTSDDDEVALLTGSRWLRCYLSLHANVYLSAAWQRVLSEKRASVDDLLALYQGALLVEPCRKRVVDRGFRALFEERYEDAIHLLVPQFEASLRRLYHRVTLHGVRNNPKDGSQHVAMLGVMLEGNDALGQAKFEHPTHWQDYAHTWAFIFCQEGFGFNLRNDVCHGLWKNEYNPAQDAYLVLMAMMQLAQCAIEAHEWLEQRQSTTSSSEEE